MKSHAENKTAPIQNINRRKEHAGSKTANDQNIKRRKNAGCVGRDNMTYVTSRLKKHVQKIADFSQIPV
jgi:hypothetical protein